MGNTRVIFSDKDKDGIIEANRLDASNDEVLQEEHYYPFGMRMNGAWNVVSGIENKYLYNSKELIDDFGLNLSDYGARWYDASIARWGSIDPLADKYNGWSPYNFVFGNPLNLIDPDGMEPTDPPGVVEKAFAYVLGGANAIASNFVTLGAPNTRMDPDNLGHPDLAYYFERGLHAGDVISIGIGAGETLIGGLKIAGGAAGSGPSAGLSLAVAVDGGVQIAHGALVMTAARNSLANNSNDGIAYSKSDDAIVREAEKDKVAKSAAKEDIARETNQPATSKIYKRPSNATTVAQRKHVQGKECVTCGANNGQKNVADHKTPLVVEHYTVGKIDKKKMRSLEAIQPQCYDCSGKQATWTRKYSMAMRRMILGK